MLVGGRQDQSSFDESHLGMKINGWILSSAVTSLLILTPIITICTYLFLPPSENWDHLIDTVLPSYIRNSIILMIGVSFGVGSIGIITAWLTSMYQFPGRRVLILALPMPLALPAYIIAYAYTGILDVSGPCQAWIREIFHLQYGEYWFPTIRSVSSAIVMFSLVLYPYVFLLARTAFINQSICVLEVSRTLGCGPLSSLIQVALPLARPTIVAGLSLALMETLADFGTVQYLGVSTFTTGIFRTWFGMYDAIAAIQLSALLMFFFLTLVLIEAYSRRKARFYHTTNRYQPLPEIKLSSKKAWFCTIFCFLPILFGFIIPIVQLIVWGVSTFHDMVDSSFIELVINSFFLSGTAATISLILALLLSYGNRIYPSRSIRFFSTFVTMGYAIPGTVIAVGILIPFSALDNLIMNWMSTVFNFTPELIFSGTVFTLLFSYVVRFLIISLQTIESGFGKIQPSMDHAARAMGLKYRQVLTKIHLPIIKGSLLTSFLIVFVDVLKELPATLLLRPFDFNTLSIRTYELASDERLADASTSALAIVAVGCLPVIFLSMAISRSRAGYSCS